MEGVAGRQTPRRQIDPAGCGQPRHQRRRTPGIGRRAYPAFHQLSRPGAGHRLDRLRSRWPHPPADRLGQARSAGARGGVGQQRAVALSRRNPMLLSSDRILTTHVGSLPRPDELIEANRAREAGEAVDEARFQETLRTAVANVVQAQKGAGIDVPGDGEFGKSMGHRVNYGAWWSYAFLRLGGLDPNGPGLYEIPARRSRPGEVVLTSFADRRDRTR